MVHPMYIQVQQNVQQVYVDKNIYNMMLDVLVMFDRNIDKYMYD